MKLTPEDAVFAQEGILYHLQEAMQHLSNQFDGSPVSNGKPPHRTRAKHELSAISYILDDLKKHLYNDDLIDEVTELLPKVG